MRFLNDNPRLTVAGLVGLVIFAALFHRAFMGGVRPEPLSRDDFARQALAFAAEEGWTSPNRVAWALPVEGDDVAEVRAAAPGAPVDRETLPDPSWEAWVVTDTQTVRSAIPTMTWPSPLLTLAFTPDGRVVQYIEASSPIAGQPLLQLRQQRRSPLEEIPTNRVFDTSPEDRVAATDEERAHAVEIAHAFFDRHAVAVADPPVSVVFREGRRAARIAYLEWRAPGPSGTVDLTRVVVYADRVAAYDHDLRAPGAAHAEPEFSVVRQIVDVLPPILIILSGSVIGVLALIRRRQGELDVRAATTVFILYFSLSFGSAFLMSGSVGALLGLMVGYQEVWFGFINFFVSFPFIALIFALILAGAWATGEGQAYVTWPQHLIRPFSAVLRGRLRSSEIVEPVARGYLLAFAALGGATLAGLFAPPSNAPSIASLLAFSLWPVTLGAVVLGISMGLLTTILAGMFAMTYARHLTKRLWVAVAVGTIVMVGTRPVFTMQQFFPASSSAALAAVAVLAFGCAMAFVRYGPLAQFVAVFVYVVLISAYPLVLTGNSSHAAIGAWTMLLACAPAGLAAYNSLRPKTASATPSVPAHVRRALDRLRIGEEFDIARRVQAQLLPNAPPDAAGLDVAGICVPANEVGGDYYDYFRTDGGPLAVAVGDVSGKGVGAAIYMTLTKSYMVTQTARVADPVGLLSRVNEHLRRNLARGTFVTMAYAVFDVEGRRLTYTRAGHNSPLHVRANGEGDFLTAPGIALGAAASATFEAITRVESVDLQAGDLVLLYTDGVTEAMNTSSDEYGDDRLVKLARRLASSGASSQAVVDALLKDVREFAGRAPQHDDITIVAVRVR